MKEAALRWRAKDIKKAFDNMECAIEKLDDQLFFLEESGIEITETLDEENWEKQ